MQVQVLLPALVFLLANACKLCYYNTELKSSMQIMCKRSSKYLEDLDFGLSPSGKAQDFDSCISLVRIQLAQFEKPDKCGKNAVFIGFFVFSGF